MEVSAMAFEWKDLAEDFSARQRDSTGKGDMSLEVAIQYTDRYNETIL